MNLYDILKQKTKKQAPNGALPNNVEESWIDDLAPDQLKALGGNGPWEQLQVGDPVIISGKGINFEGATGEVAEVGREGKFLVVDLYNHGKHSFHSSDVSYNDYADSDDEEARMHDAGEFRDEMDEESSPMIKPPSNRFDSKSEAFAYAKEHGGKVFKRTYIDPNTGNEHISFVVKKDNSVAEARANTAGVRAGLTKRKNTVPLTPEEQAAKDKAKADKWLEKERAKMAAKKGVAEGSLNEFAPGNGGGESGRWYTDDQMTDLVGDGWWQDLDISGDVSKQEMMHEAQAWLADNGYRVQVLNVKVNDDDCEWFIEGSFQNSRFAKKGVAEASPETSLNLLKGLKSWQVVIMNNYYRGKYSDYSGRYYYVLASSPEEAKQVVLDNADAILHELLAMKSHNGKKILPRGTAVRITPERINGVKDGTEAGRMSTAGFKKMFGPQGPMMVKLSNGAIVDVQGQEQEQGVAEGGFKNMYAEFSGYGNYMQGRAVNVFKKAGLEIVSKEYSEDDDIQTYVVKGDRWAIEKAGEFLERNPEQYGGYHFVKQGMAEDSLDEVSRGDYYKKATMGKAMAQMSAGFARSPEEREKFNQIAGRRERGLARSKARTDKFWADKAAKDEADRLEQLRAKYAGVDIDAEIAKLKPAIDSAYHEYQYGARNTYSQGRDDYNSLMGRVQELERAKKALADNPPLSELSNQLLGNYKKAAGISARDLDKAGKYKQADKRFHGIVQATKKELDNDMKKHQHDEITESRLASMKRAGYDIK